MIHIKSHKPHAFVYTAVPDDDAPFRGLQNKDDDARQ